MAQVTSENIKRQAYDFIYCFIRDEQLTRKYFGKYLPIIRYKRDSQRKYLRALASMYDNTNQQQAYDNMLRWVVEGIAEQCKVLKNPETGKFVEATPNLVLYYLSMGQPVGNKDWSRGVYGITGAVGSVSAGNSLLNDYGYNLNNKTGVITDYNGATLASGNNYYNGNLFSKNYLSKDGKFAITTDYDTKTKEYAVSSMSNSGGIIGSDSSGSWLNSLQIIVQMIPVIVNMCYSIKQLQAGALSGVNPIEVAPEQVADGWADTTGESSNTGLLLGGALLAGAVVLGVKK